ncbi:hypothetical protein AWM75_00220 [Aerococcus urinaehominis]|uniref:Ribosomal protein L11 methyltransferase n=1 Tax=Aerococcus urinaehominis TaxID=128944 RepID=A0A0X8FK00_9LACT|nr:50S ribosomal protein L11 methyltransferase [Aerococcus urinaehominis]AMB98509.1 hypothetical protein AWM75_00220 [Aerococcus urinaehominis]SDL80205.1 ribosomal protein L11 methyltransferase [Aerococcus urinaehominis]
MAWLELSLRLQEADPDSVSAFLIDIGALGTEIIDQRDVDQFPDDYLGTITQGMDLSRYQDQPLVKAYFDQNSDQDQLLDQIHQAWGSQISPDQVSFNRLEDQDWGSAYKTYYQPIQLSRYLRIVPLWQQDQDQASDQDGQAIYLDPGLAFGTGSHATTQVALKLLELTIRPGDRVYDVGTGSGILAIAAAKFGASWVRGLEYDGQVLDTARENVVVNQVDQVVEIAQADLLAGQSDQVDLITANIVVEILLPLVPQAYDLLKVQGRLLLSGIYKDNIDQMQTCLRDHNFAIELVVRRGDWYGILASKGRDASCKDIL